MYATEPNDLLNSERIIADLRSDTVTRPTQAMREHMNRAKVGDDVYEEDPTVSELEDYCAGLLGKEAGLFVTSGTQSNLIALLCHCRRGEEYISGDSYHIAKYEAAGAAVLGGISHRHLTPDENGALSPQQVMDAIRPDNIHFPVSRLVCLENTYNGRVQDQGNIEKIAEIARANGLRVHLDGARLMNAAIVSGREPRELAKEMDSVSLCLSKGLGAPVGSVLCGSRDFVKTARRWRKMLGGGLRQSGILAAAGLYALRNHIERLKDDHQNARNLAERLDRIEGVTVDMESVQTNMIWLKLQKGQKGLARFMLERGIIVGEGEPVRLVCHLDFDPTHIERIVEAFDDFCRNCQK